MEAFQLEVGITEGGNMFQNVKSSAKRSRSKRVAVTSAREEVHESFIALI